MPVELVRGCEFVVCFGEGFWGGFDDGVAAGFEDFAVDGFEEWCGFWLGGDADDVSGLDVGGVVDEDVCPA